MDFKHFYLSLDGKQRERLARKCNTTPGQLRNVAYGKKAGESLAISLEQETGIHLLANALRPDCKELFDFLRAGGKKGRKAGQVISP